MGEIKPGDRVWVKDVAALIDEGIVFVETGADGNGYATHSCYNVDGYAIPDSPVLPAVAALLHEPGLAAAVRKVIETAVAFDTLPHVADSYQGKVSINLADWRAADKGISDGAIAMARKLAAALEVGDGNG